MDKPQQKITNKVVKVGFVTSKEIIKEQLQDHTEARFSLEAIDVDNKNRNTIKGKLVRRDWFSQVNIYGTFVGFDTFPPHKIASHSSIVSGISLRSNRNNGTELLFVPDKEDDNFVFFLPMPGQEDFLLITAPESSKKKKNIFYNLNRSPEGWHLTDIFENAGGKLRCLHDIVSVLKEVLVSMVDPELEKVLHAYEKEYNDTLQHRIKLYGLRIKTGWGNIKVKSTEKEGVLLVEFSDYMEEMSQEKLLEKYMDYPEAFKIVTQELENWKADPDYVKKQILRNNGII